jgi:hypothetical protein
MKHQIYGAVAFCLLAVFREKTPTDEQVQIAVCRRLLVAGGSPQKSSQVALQTTDC